MIDAHSKGLDNLTMKDFLFLLIARWKILIIWSAIGMAVGIILGLLLPKSYKADALVAITKPDMIFRFDPRIVTESQAPSERGIIQLAESDEVLKSLLNALGSRSPRVEQPSIQDIRDQIDAVWYDGLLRLSIKHMDAEIAAFAANTWATMVVEKLNGLYSPALRSDMQFRIQSRIAYQDWMSAQEAITQFEKENNLGIIRNRLETLLDSHKALLDGVESLRLLRTDVEQMIKVYREKPDDEIVKSRDQIVALLLAVGSSTLRIDESLNELDIGGITIEIGYVPSEEHAADILNSLMLMHGNLIEKESLYLDRAKSIEADIPKLQSELSYYRESLTRLQEGAARAREKYVAVSRKADENALALQTPNTVAKLAALAEVPEEIDGPSIIIVSIGTTLMGLIIGLAIIVLRLLIVDESGGSDL